MLFSRLIVAMFEGFARSYKSFHFLCILEAHHEISMSSLQPGIDR